MEKKIDKAKIAKEIKERVKKIEDKQIIKK